MLAVLAFLTIDSLDAIRAGGARVPPYTVINQEIGYAHDARLGHAVPLISGEQLLFGREYTGAEARALIAKGKRVIQSRACMACHTFFGNGAYYGPDLTKAWLDPAWGATWMPMTRQATREGAMVEFLMQPERYPNWSRQMPNLGIERDEAMALVAYLKWMSAVDTNGFPANFGMIRTASPAAREEPAAAGERAHDRYCAACHQADGLGVPGLFPPIAAGEAFSAPERLVKPLAERGFYRDGKIVQGPVRSHIEIVLHGIPGTAMPGFAARLDDATIAAIVTYQRNAFGNRSGDVVQPDDVRAAR